MRSFSLPHHLSGTTIQGNDLGDILDEVASSKLKIVSPKSTRKKKNSFPPEKTIAFVPVLVAAAPTSLLSERFRETLINKKSRQDANERSISSFQNIVNV